MAALAKEIATFDAMLPRLLGEAPGRFVLIKGEVLEGTFDKREAALARGYELHPGESFLVRQVLTEQPVRNLTRPLKPD